ncbi:MAG: SsrA-binding protein SmpB [Candidatus Omnitrophica bacterium]|nr:SsrA-binding protein SmpB [Candidatus Omnitrophota bacterium]MDD5672266.1 SsrA-binding protein SmpB [Candidatus Omnitrophota bacterium]
MTQIAVNRKARHDFFLFDKYEAGICLLGNEVKSIREGRVNLKDSFVRVIRGEAYLVNCHISAYSKIQGHVEVDPTRLRKLLLNRVEIDKLYSKSAQKGFSIVPTEMYFKKGKVKVEIAIAQGKKQFDKRETIKRRMHDREAASAIKQHKRKGR